MEPQNAKSILTQLIELRDKELEAATHLFVVCGQPSTVEGFHQAWMKEDMNWFMQFTALNSTIKVMQGIGLK